MSMFLKHTHTHVHALRHTHTNLLRKTLLTSSWLMGGFLELAAILRGLRKQLTRMQSWWTYLSSDAHSHMLFRCNRFNVKVWTRADLNKEIIRQNKFRLKIQIYLQTHPTCMSQYVSLLLVYTAFSFVIGQVNSGVQNVLGFFSLYIH